MIKLAPEDKVVHSDTGETLIFVYDGVHMGQPAAFCKRIDDDETKAYDPQKLKKINE